jgi:hypothetical protein
MELFQEVLARYPTLDAFYKTVDKPDVSRGFAAFISIPTDAWDALDAEQQEDLGHFMCRESPINGWAIYVGEVEGSDVVLDRTGLSSRDWPPKTKSPNQPLRTSATKKLRDYLRDNFGNPGYETSWYGSIIEVTVIGDTARARVSLSVGDSRLGTVCGAISGFVYANTNRHLGIEQVQLVGLSGDVLMHRKSVTDSCR